MKVLLTNVLFVLLAGSTPAGVGTARGTNATQDTAPARSSTIPGATPSTPQEQKKSNRDRHGPPDVDRYIRMLEDPGRRAWDDPDKVIEALKLRATDWIVDLGCGPGFYTLPLALAVNKGLVLALDVEPRQLDRLNEHLAQAKLTNVIPVLTPPDVPRAPLGRIDVVLIVDTYHHLEDRSAYLARLAHLLKPDGRFVVVDFYKKPLPVGPPPAHKLSRDTVITEAETAGFHLRQQIETRKYQYVLVFERGKDN